MKAVSSPRHADYVEPDLTRSRIDRMWTGIEGAEERPRASRLLWIGGAAAAVAALGVAAALSLGAAQPVDVRAEAPAAAPLEWIATASESKTVTLPDGTRLSLGPETQVRVLRGGAAESSIRLERGAVDCRTPDGRSLVVQAGTAKVKSADATFSVELQMIPDTGPVLDVAVERGRVEVRDGASLAKLEGGQRWSNQKMAAPPDRADTPSQKAPLAARAPAAPPQPASRTARPDAATLMARAKEARLSGDVAEAAAEYDRLRRMFPTDSRAGLAAFEAGRIRLDSLSDPNGALEAFDAALASGKSGFFAEDAKVGRIRALNELGSNERCLAEQRAFLAAHPKSPHVARVRRLCNAR